MLLFTPQVLRLNVPAVRFWLSFKVNFARVKSSSNSWQLLVRVVKKSSWANHFDSSILVLSHCAVPDLLLLLPLNWLSHLTAQRLKSRWFPRRSTVGEGHSDNCFVDIISWFADLFWDHSALCCWTECQTIGCSERISNICYFVTNTLGHLELQLVQTHRHVIELWGIITNLWLTVIFSLSFL